MRVCVREHTYGQMVLLWLFLVLYWTLLPNLKSWVVIMPYFKCSMVSPFLFSCMIHFELALQWEMEEVEVSFSGL